MSNCYCGAAPFVPCGADNCYHRHPVAVTTRTMSELEKSTTIPSLSWRLSQYICQIANTRQLNAETRADLMACLAQAVGDLNTTANGFTAATNDAERARRAWLDVCSAHDALLQKHGMDILSTLRHDLGWKAGIPLDVKIEEVLDLQERMGGYLDVLYIGTLGRLPIGRASLLNKLLTCTTFEEAYDGNQMHITFGNRNQDGAFVGYIRIDY